MTALDSVPAPVLVAVGGAVGALARWGVGRVALLGGLPAEVGTLVVNLVGAFAIGVLVARTGDPQIRVLLGTGVLGGFTTFSTFALDGLGLAGRPWAAAAYLVGSVVLGLAACQLGQRLAGAGA